MCARCPECPLSSKNGLTKSKFKNELHLITSNELNFPTQTEFANVAKHSFTQKDCEVMLKHIFKRLQCRPEKWRKVLKTLTLIETLVSRGSKKTMFEFKNKVFLLQNLNKFGFWEGSIDRGAQSGLRSKRLVPGLGRGDQRGRPDPV